MASDNAHPEAIRRALDRKTDEHLHREPVKEDLPGRSAREIQTVMPQNLTVKVDAGDSDYWGSMRAYAYPPTHSAMDGYVQVIAADVYEEMNPGAPHKVTYAETAGIHTQTKHCHFGSG